VAKSDRSASRDSEPRSFSRHFEGWQPGLVAVAVAGITALLAVPRSVEPRELPRPIADARELRFIQQKDDTVAQAITRSPLDVDVRALGSLLRAFGTADAARDEPMLAQLRSRISLAVLTAKTHGDEQLLALRAFQMQAFVREVRHFVATGETSPELVELGGSFADALLRYEWCEGPRPCVMHMGEHVLRVMFKRRWNEISGLTEGPFAPTLDEQRVFYDFLLQHPPQTTHRLDEANRSTFDGSYLLRKVDELGAIDPTYPRLFARGIIQFRAGDFRRASQSFSGHLELSPDGPWTIRAQNHLRAALERSSAEPL
jgi:hypothetical protein